MTKTIWTFDWGNIRGEVAALGGMLGPVWFRRPDGREVQPFAIAPWADDPPEKLETLPPILRNLRGEFPCVPFGGPATRTDLPDRWVQGLDLSAAAPDSFAHGYSANQKWHLVAQTKTALTIAIDYPDDHVVRRLERRISLDGDLRIKLDLHIEMRRDATLPVGLHPIFALPTQAGAAHISIPSQQTVRSFPVAVDDEKSLFVADQTAQALTHIATKNGTTMDASRLPFAAQTEELLAVTLSDGAVRLTHHQDDYAVDLTWDIQTFPQCLLWISNHGRQAYPWDGRFCALGIEPVAAAFDLGAAHANNAQSPLSISGTATTIALSNRAPFNTSYHIALREI